MYFEWDASIRDNKKKKMAFIHGSTSIQWGTPNRENKVICKADMQSTMHIHEADMIEQNQWPGPSQFDDGDRVRHWTHKTSHISPSQVSYEVSVVNILEKFDHVMMVLHYSLEKTDYAKMVDFAVIIIQWNPLHKGHPIWWPFKRVDLVMRGKINMICKEWCVEMDQILQQ